MLQLLVYVTSLCCTCIMQEVCNCTNYDAFNNYTMDWKASDERCQYPQVILLYTKFVFYILKFFLVFLFLCIAGNDDHSGVHTFKLDYKECH